MKLYPIFISLLLLVTWPMGTVTVQAQSKQAGLKKGANLSLNITNNHKQPPSTYFNIGLISNYPDLNGFGLNIISSLTHYDSKGFQISGLANITGIDAGGFHLAGLANINGRNIYGINIGGLVNVAGKTTKGFSLSGLGNISGGNISGTAISSLLNISSQSMKGFYIAGLANVAKKEQAGVMIGGGINLAGDTLRGAQVTALMNIVGNTNKGVQLAGVSNLAVKNCGLQFSPVNYTETNKGLQLGLMNFSANTHKGLQIGILNLSNDSISSNQIGLFNLNPHTHTQMIVGSGNLNIVHISARFKNRFTYTEIGGGAYPLGLDKELSLSAFYRMGLFCNPYKNIELAADIAFNHIEALNNGHKNNCPERLYALQPRINIAYYLTSKLGFFAAGGYNWTLYYDRSDCYLRKCTFEAGIILF